MPLKLSFTGTRNGMTRNQKAELRGFLYQLESIEQFSHGCCTGADIEAHVLVRLVFGFDPLILVRPSTATTKATVPDVEFATNYPNIRLFRPENPLHRNRLIVADGDELLACPASIGDVRRSGTWATIRYARSVNKTVHLFGPDGQYTKEINSEKDRYAICQSSIF